MYVIIYLLASEPLNSSKHTYTASERLFLYQAYYSIFNRFTSTTGMTRGKDESDIAR